MSIDRIETPSPQKRVITALLVCILLLTVGATATVAAAGYDITVPGATDVPPETIEDPPGLVGNEYEVDAFAVQDPGEELTVEVSVPDETAFEDTEVQIMNSDQGYEDAAVPNADGEATFSSDEMDLEPGTYSLLLAEDITEAIHPIVISGYDVEVTNPTSASENEDITVEATVTQTESNEPPTVVNAVIWNDDSQEQIEMSSNEDNDDTYTADISLDQFAPGEYEVYVTAHGDEEFRGEKEVLGLGEGSSLNIEEVADNTDDSTDNTNGGDGGGGGSSGTSSGGAAGGGGISPVASESRSIADESPGEPGMTVQFSQGHDRAV